MSQYITSRDLATVFQYITSRDLATVSQYITSWDLATVSQYITSWEDAKQVTDYGHIVRQHRGWKPQARHVPLQHGRGISVKRRWLGRRGGWRDRERETDRDSYTVATGPGSG